MSLRRRRHRMLAALTWVGAGMLLGACGDAAPISPLHIPVQTATAPPTPIGTQAGGVTPAPTLPSPRPPVPLECNPPADEPSTVPHGSDLRIEGACTFTETSAVACSTQPDDFLFQFARRTPNGPTIYFQLNVENYKGPGTYASNVQAIFEIPDNGTTYEWDSQDASTTVDVGQRSGSIHRAVLPADAGTPTRGTVTIDGSFVCN